MNDKIEEAAVSYESIDFAINLHNWAATGVSDYPPRDPLVGQSGFFHQYRQFIRTVDQDADNFAHVFAVKTTLAVIEQPPITHCHLTYPFTAQFAEHLRFIAG